MRNNQGTRTMGLFTKDIGSMEDLFRHGLQDIYYAEKQIVEALPTMIEKATNRQLAAALRNHLRETETQVARLDQVFHKFGQEPQQADCPAIDGLIKEADEVAGEVEDKQVLDAAVIAAAQAVEHYEISRYGTLIAWAEELGHNNVTSLLNANLREEKAADRKLNTLAEGKVNPRATGHRTAAARSGVQKTKRSGTVRTRRGH
jgi:ferritin-like metal-binding protein YciE